MIYISSQEDLLKNPGVSKKIQGQIRAFMDLLRDEAVLVCNRDGKIVMEAMGSGLKDNKTTILGSCEKVLDKIFYYKVLLNNLHLILNRSRQAKLVYLRLVYYDRHLLKLISKLRSMGLYVIAEIPTPQFYVEYAKRGPVGWYKLWNFILYGCRILHAVDMIVSIGGISPVLHGMENKVLVITNGIDDEDVKSYAVGSPKFSTTTDEFNLIGVANVSFWHGFDRVIRGLRSYYDTNTRREPVIFHIVGEGKETKKLKLLVQKLDLNNAVIFHGVKVGEQLEELYRRAHLAIGSLGLHRIRFGGNPLKHREYCARGIPFVTEGCDPDFRENFPFVFRVPPDESPIDIDSLIKFYKRIERDFPNYPEIMRDYAINNLTWKTKVLQILDFLHSRVHRM